MLALGEGIEVRGLAGDRACKSPRDLVEQLASYRDRQHRVAGGHGAYRLDDLLGRRVLEQKAARATARAFSPVGS
jgi:hypothetical protein